MRYVYRPDHPEANSNGLIAADIAPPKVESHSAPYIISDTMQPLRHMGTGKIIDSKAKFRADTKASGCIETGNEIPKPRLPIRLDKRQRREDIQRAVDDLRNNTR